MKKKKRERSSSRILLITVITGALVLLLGLMALLFLGDFTPQEPYATQAWDDPHAICNTEWMNPEIEHQNPELVQALSELPVTTIDTILEFAAQPCFTDEGIPHDRHRDIMLRVEVEEAAISDPEEMGQLLHEMLEAISSTEISQTWENVDVICVVFDVDGTPLKRWRLNYQEALRAHEAGISGYVLYEIGDFP